MTNVAAAIGLAQVEQAEWHMKRHLEVAAWYRERLAGVPAVLPQTEISLPTWAGLSADDVHRVCTSLLECLAS
jgi:dTDP-4-amino-4,6-dideoxygalactose transaminase